MIDADQLFRVRERQRLQQDTVHDAEDRRVRADADGQRERRHAREHRHPQQPPDDMFEFHAHSGSEGLGLRGSVTVDRTRPTPDP